MSALDARDRGDRPDEVLTFGGNAGRKYHRVAEFDSELRAGCGQGGRNPLRKDRAVIETHYEPCQRCFPRREGDQ